MKEKEKLNFIEGIRFFAVLLVVVDHFNDSLMQYGITILDKNFIVPYIFNNNSYGMLGVSLFFMISGVSLYYNYGEKFDLKTYFKKRFLNIYPMFWCSYIAVFLITFFRYKEFVFEINESIPTSRFLLTFLGMDGYFSYLGKNFYLIGEWFLGCIILLYILFPVLRYCVKKYPVITWIIATVIYILVIIYNPFKIGLTRNLFVRGYDFLFGMLLIRCFSVNLNISKKIIIGVLSGVGFIFCMFYTNIKYPMCMITMSGIALFIFLIVIFEKLNLGKVFVVKIVNKYSYEIFLLHHATLSICFERFRGYNYSLFEGITLMFIYIVILCIFIVVVSKFKNIICDIFSKQKQIIKQK